ncbi:carbohydrate ABC transporter permease [Paenibacillus sacheonensis]|uniref:ABC transporter permease subunit n=1 Tax=Paenibacillus sacheonensis TaxID=742054 RepID=A0A7X5BZE3_9BACL|nr:carbohydrate ABC transporter permease [Paenibacillus sacheonensis]MBM7568902.1 putative aldouronate transport system permease protein [Paenibacillus sacheonensis]NBC72603.1 ABC transporter permease subunit [Paenibacillus sacheonensis]
MPQPKAYAFIVNAILTVICFISLFPLVMTIMISITDTKDLASFGYSLIPRHFSLDAYVYLFKVPTDIINGYRNSLIITVVGTVVNLFITALVAYPLSRRDFRYRGIVSGFIFLTMIFNGGLVPLYILIVKYLEWKNTLTAIIVPALALPFNIFLLRVLFQDIPPALTEAAKIDGSSDWGTFFRIILPLSKPAMATLALISALGYWNEAFAPILFIDETKKYPIQLVLNNIVSAVNFIKKGNVMPGSVQAIDPNSVPSDSIMFAMMVIATLPMVFLFTYLQKYFIKGLTVGAIKG